MSLSQLSQDEYGWRMNNESPENPNDGCVLIVVYIVIFVLIGSIWLVINTLNR